MDNIDNELDIHEYIRIIKRRQWIIIGVIILSLIFASLYLIYSPPLYNSSSSILIKKVPTLFGQGYFETPTYEELMNHIFLLKSEPVIKRTVDNFGLNNLSRMNFDSAAQAVSRIKKDIKKGWIKIGVEGDSRIINIKVTETNPYRSMLFANELAKSYRNFDIDMKREDARSTHHFIEDQIKMVKEDLSTAEEKLRSFKEKHSVLGISDELEGFVQQMAEVEKNYRQAKVESEVLKKELSTIEKRLSERERNLVSKASKTSYDVLMDLKKQLTNLENNRADLLIAGYSPDDEKVLRVEKSLESTKEKMDEVIRNMMKERGIMDPLVEMKDLLQKSLKLSIDYTVAKTRMEAFHDVLSYYQSKLKDIPERELQLARLEREKEANEKIYMMLLEKKEQAQISEISELGDVFILNLADMPDKPSILSKAKKGILFVILGIFIALGSGFLTDYVDSAIRSETDISRITGSPVLASIPVVGERKSDELIILDMHSSTPMAEAFRRLRTNIKLSRAEGLPPSLLITSPDKECGKTTVAINLALSFASAGENVLLVDSDLRRPKIEKYLGISKSEGLSDLLADSDEEIEFFKFNHINILSSGTLPPNPTELLDSEKMKNMIEKWKKDFDLVILDSPPILTVSDASILANEVDGTVVVTSYGETSKGMITSTKELLDQLSIKPLGYILNKIQPEKEYGYYHYYSYYKSY